MEYDEIDVKNRMDLLSNDDILTLSAFIMSGNYSYHNPLHVKQSDCLDVIYNKRAKQKKRYLVAIAGK